jgi:hypothetical protein
MALDDKDLRYIHKALACDSRACGVHLEHTEKDEKFKEQMRRSIRKNKGVMRRIERILKLRIDYVWPGDENYDKGTNDKSDATSNT